MIDLTAIRAAFAELNNITPLRAISGQKDVFSAEKGTDRVALKIIRKLGPQQDRAEREIAAVAMLNSDYVPKVYDHGRRVIGGEERYYIIEEYVEGETYRERLIRTPVQPLQDVLALASILLQACGDFEAAGTDGLVHRDIKPENLIIDRNRKIWVIDFGIVRFLGMQSITPDQQRFGMFTLGYGAPEQMRNLKPQINSRADLFSIGVVLYESIVGYNPYGAGRYNDFVVLQRMENTDLPRLTIAEDSDGELSEFIASLTSRFPSRRPQTAREAIEWFAPIYRKLKT